MKKIIAVFITIILFIFIFLTVGFIYLKLNATTIVNKKLAEVMPAVKIGKIDIKYPLTLKLHQIKVRSIFSLDNIAEVKEVSASLSILGLLSRKLIINKLTIIEPQLNIFREKDGVFNILSLKSKFYRKKKSADKKLAKKRISIIIANLVIKNGTVYITDMSQEKPLKLILSDVNLKISNLVFPDLSKTNFKGGCKIFMDRGEGEINAGGWVDMMHKSMDGEITAKDINLIYFNRFLSFLSLKDFAMANLDAVIKLNALNNDLNIACHLDIYNLFFEKKKIPFPVLKEAISGTPAIGDNALSTLFSALKPAGNKIKLDFAINTKLDAPLINKAVLQEAIIKELKKRLANLPVDILKTRTKNVIEGIKDEIKDAGVDVIKDTFKNLKRMFE